MKRKVQLRHQFPENYDTNEAGDDAGLDTGTDGGAQQNFKDECDINVMLKKFGIGYELPQGLRAPMSGDFTGIRDFHQAMNAINQARETFEELPANIRARFQNDPGQFVDFATNNENRKQLEEWGMTIPKPPTIIQDRGEPAPQGGGSGKDKAAAKGAAERPEPQKE